jgi:hypothetical protein
MDEQQQNHEGRLLRFGRRHPLWTVAGVAAAGLVGGIEMAAGVLLGAAALALVRRTKEEPAPESPRAVRSETLQKIKDRAHAVMMAARGEQPQAH